MACCWTPNWAFITNSEARFSPWWKETGGWLEIQGQTAQPQFFEGSPEFASASTTGVRVWNALSTAVAQWIGNIRESRIHHRGVPEYPFGYHSASESRRGASVPVIFIIAPDWYFQQCPAVQQLRDKFYVNTPLYALDSEGDVNTALREQVQDMDPFIAQWEDDRDNSWMNCSGQRPPVPPGLETWHAYDLPIHIQRVYFEDVYWWGGATKLQTQFLSNLGGLLEIDYHQNFAANPKAQQALNLATVLISQDTYDLGRRQAIDGGLDEFDWTAAVASAKPVPSTASDDFEFGFTLSTIDESYNNLYKLDTAEQKERFGIRINGVRYRPPEVGELAEVAVDAGAFSFSANLPFAPKPWTDPDVINDLYDLMKFIPVQHWSSPDAMQEYGG